MSLLVQPRLVNAPEGDPGVYLDFRFGKRAMLFDLGDLAPLTHRELHRVSHVFVSHAHMDHVAGFERLLRQRLHKTRPLHLTGPPGFVDKVAARLASYSWNLLDETAVDFRLTAQDFDGARVAAAAEFRARGGFARRDLPLPEGDAVLAEAQFEIRGAALDHGIPSLAFALHQRRRLNVRPDALERLGLAPGPWLDGAKEAARADLPDDHRIEVPGAGEVTLGRLREEVLRGAPGQHIAYVTDAADTPENRARIVALAQDADILFIEAPFLDADRPLAEATAHLTARAAGEIAAEAGVRRVVPFHHSARYGGDTSPLRAEVMAAFGDPCDPEAVDLGRKVK